MRLYRDASRPTDQFVVHEIALKGLVHTTVHRLQAQMNATQHLLHENLVTTLGAKVSSDRC